MDAKKSAIDSAYTRFYAERRHHRVYPTEFVVRIFLGCYPGLSFRKPVAGDSILDVGIGDGRNTAFLCDLGLDVHGLEITPEIVEQTRVRLAGVGYEPRLNVGRNSSIPYGKDEFDYILACHVCYYCDAGQTLADNLREYARVLKPGGTLIASVADRRSYIFDGAQRLEDGTLRIREDPFGNRAGYRLQAFGEEGEIERYFTPLFRDFCFGRAHNDYFGIGEKVFWVVCQKAEAP